MAWACGGCGAGFTLRLSACPRCGATADWERTGIVAKITAHGGATDQNAQPGEPGWIEPDDDAASDDDEGGEDVSPGTSSSGSSKTPADSTTSGPVDGPKRARTTASPSSRGRAGRSTAGSTDSPGRTTG